MGKIQKIIQCFGTLKSNIKYGRNVGEIASIMEDAGKLGRIKNTVKGVFTTSIKPMTDSFVCDMKGLKDLPVDLAQAYKTGKNVSEEFQHGTVRSALSVTKSVYNGGIKPHMAGLLGTAGTFVPIPFIQPVFYFVGKCLQVLF